MNGKREVTVKTSTSRTKNSTTTTTVTTWKSEVRSTSVASSSGQISSNTRVAVPYSRSRTEGHIVLGKGISTDASPVYTPVYPRSTSRTTLLGPPPNKTNLFYTFPKSPPEAKYAPPPIRQTQQRPITNYPRDQNVTLPPTITTSYPTRVATPFKPTAPPVTNVKPSPKDDVYSQSFAKSKRLVYILNHNTYVRSYQNERKGSLEDVKTIKETFSKFNVTIKERHDQTRAQIIEMAKKQATKNYRGFDFIIFIIMTHGGTEKNLAARDAMYNLERDFVQEMQSNPTWVGVPKVYIIQACRGDLETDAVPFKRVPPFAPNDTLKLFATYEGYVSYRTSAGTYFIQELCDKLNQHGSTDELMTIMRRVTQEVSKKAPTPEQSSTLQKALYLGKIGK